MKKILTLSFCFLLVLSLTVFSSFAEETQPVTAPAEGTPITALLVDFITQNSDTLLGVLTLLGSLLVAFFYKKGLLPMLRSGLSALADLLGKAEHTTKEFTQNADDALKRIEAYTAPVLAVAERSEAAVRELAEQILTLEKALAASEKDRKNTASVLATETELFYELLSSVNLPEAQKDSMTESYYRLKKKLEE